MLKKILLQDVINLIGEILISLSLFALIAALINAPRWALAILIVTGFWLGANGLPESRLDRIMRRIKSKSKNN